MRSRTASINTVSFFAFQDIITSVVGIFVLITLIMMLELVQTKVGASGGVESVPAEVMAQLEELESEVAQLRQVHEKLQANAQKIADRNSFTLEQELATLTSQQRELDDELQDAIKRTEKLNKQLGEREASWETANGTRKRNWLKSAKKPSCLPMLSTRRSKPVLFLRRSSFDLPRSNGSRSIPGACRARTRCGRGNRCSNRRDGAIYSHISH